MSSSVYYPSVSINNSNYISYKNVNSYNTSYPSTSSINSSSTSLYNQQLNNLINSIPNNNKNNSNFYCPENKLRSNSLDIDIDLNSISVDFDNIFNDEFNITQYNSNFSLSSTSSNEILSNISYPNSYSYSTSNPNSSYIINKKEDYLVKPISYNTEIYNKNSFEKNQLIVSKFSKNNKLNIIKNKKNIKKKKNINYVPVNRFPIIIKKDFRRYFAQMLTNVMNSHDIILINQFYSHFFLSSAFFLNSIKFISPISTFKVTNNTLFNFNISNFLIFYLFQIAKAPDEILTVRDIHLTQYKDYENTLLSFKGTITFTQLYDIDEYPKEISESFYELNNKDEYIEKLLNDLVHDTNNITLKKTSKLIKKTNPLYEKIINKEIQYEDIIQLKILKEPRKIKINLFMRYIFNSNNKVIAMISDQIE